MQGPPGDTLAWLARSALAAMATHHSEHPRVETGGVLVGYWVDDAEVVITDATTAGPLARHAQYAYVPDAVHDAAEIARLYAASGRRQTYLGDWHSHPAGGLGLSRRDRRTLADIARHEEARASTPLMAVLADASDALAVSVWVLRRRRTRYRAEACRVRPFGK